MKKLFPQSIKNIYHLLQAILANVCFGFPSRKLKVIGVTGTNGKTTTTQMIVRILEEAGYKVAVTSTINFKIGDKEWVNATKFTTLSSWKLQKYLREAVAKNCSHAIIEITSHALDQNRAWGTDFSAAVLTNITREHLDYHKAMERYARAKAKLFAMVSKNKSGISIINMNSEFADNFLKYKTSRKYGYFLETVTALAGSRCGGKNCYKDEELRIKVARDIKLSATGSKFLLDGQPYELSLPGEFNVENALAAICVGLSQNISTKKISEALANMKSIPGRMERIENDSGLEIIVDYAVTPDSLEKLYNYLEGIKKEEANIIAVFGSCGERDRGKRPIMGEVVAKYADYVIVTNEDPYSEDPVRIINEVFGGVGKKVDSEIPNFQFPTLPTGRQVSDFQTNSNPKNLKYKTENVNCWRIMDRKEAIKKALQMAKPGDIVVVTGKGAEETMAIGKKRIPWNDPKVIREVLQELAPK